MTLTFIALWLPKRPYLVNDCLYSRIVSKLSITHFCVSSVPVVAFRISHLSIGLRLRLVHGPVFWCQLKCSFRYVRRRRERHCLALQQGIFTESVVSHCCESAAVIEYDLCEQIVVERLLPNLYDTRRQIYLFEVAPLEAPFPNVFQVFRKSDDC